MQSIKSIVTSSANAQSLIRNQNIDFLGFDVKVYATFNDGDLTEMGEISYFTKRSTSIMRILPAFDIQYYLQPFTETGKVDEVQTRKELVAFIKTTDNINQGDLIEITYSFYQGTLDKKFYQVNQVIINSVLQPVDKKIVCHPYMLPVSRLESEAVDPNAVPAFVPSIKNRPETFVI